MAKKTPNPYDRREGRRGRADHGDTVNVDGYAFDLLADGRRAYPGFTLARLEEVMRDEFARGFNCGEGTMERKFEEEILPRVRRQVWDEGHAAGHAVGARELLVRIAEKFESVAVELEADIGQVLKEEGATVEQMRPVLSRAGRLLSQLITAHHDGFEGMPF